MDTNSFFSNRRIVVLITALIVVIIVMFLIRVFTQSPNEESNIKPTPTVAQSSPLVASSSAQIISSQPTIYTPGNLNKDYQRIQARKALSDADAAIKKKILTPLGGKSGFVETQVDFQIEYLAAADTLMIELRGSNADQAKKTAEKYLQNLGFSPEGICNLPVVLYLNPLTQKDLLDRGKTFDPIPDGC